MSSNLNRSPYLRVQRTFPEETKQLSVELSRSYIDIANAVNNRTIGLFPIFRPIITGESWFVNKNERQQTFRQVYNVVGPANVIIAHGIKLNQIGGFTRIYGTFTDGTNWYPLPYVDNVNANNQIKLIIDPSNINIIAGAGTPPTISTGFVVLEWLSNATFNTEST